MKNILILCTGNSCRSQIAEGYFRHFHGDRYAVYSAGVEVHGVNPRAVKVMQEDGIDLSNHTSNHVDEYKDIDFSVVVTVCDHAKEVCPVLPGTHKKSHHNFPDPAKAKGEEEAVMNEFRRVRGMIREYVKVFEF